MSKKQNNLASSTLSAGFKIPRFSWILGGIGLLLLVLSFFLQHVVSFATSGSKNVLFIYQSLSNAFSWLFVILEAGAIYFAFLAASNPKNKKSFKTINEDKITGTPADEGKEVFNPLSIIEEEKSEESPSEDEAEPTSDDKEIQVSETKLEDRIWVNVEKEEEKTSPAPISEHNEGSKLVDVELPFDEPKIEHIAEEVKSEVHVETLELIDAELPFNEAIDNNEANEVSTDSEVHKEESILNNNSTPLPVHVDPTNDLGRFLA